MPDQAVAATESKETPFDALNGGLVAMSAIAAVVTAFGLPGGAWVDTISHLGLAALLALTAFLVARSVELVPEEDARGWTIVGYAISVLVAGELTFLLVGPRPFPSLVDLFMVGFVVLVGTGLLSLPWVKGSTYGTMRLALDATAGTIAIAALALEWVVSGTGNRWETVEISILARPAIALVLSGALMVAVVRRTRYRLDRRLIAMATGSSLMILAEVLTPVLEVRMAEAQRPVIALRFAAVAAFGVTAWAMRRPVAKRDVALSRPTFLRLMLPYAVVVAMFAVFFWQSVSVGGRVSGPLPWGALIVAGVLLVRQAVATRENREIIEMERDQLIAAVSHELRTPLTAVTGFADVIWEEWGSLTETDAREMVDIIRFQSHFLSGIVTDLAALVRNDLDSIRLEPERIDARVLIADAIKAVFDLNAGPLPVTAQVEPYMEVIGDRERLTQVLVALLKNAQRYGDGKILIVARRSDDGRYFEVHDDGDGVPAKYEQLVWERFERGAHRLNANVPGSGLGLSIVRAVAKAHGGRADYRRSERLGGACFTVEIPYD